MKLVPEFKGSDVNNFIHLFKRAKKTKRNEGGILLDGIISQKLTDRAAGCVRADGIESYGELLGRLRLLFGDRETLHTLQKQRDLALMGRTEGRGSFFSRFMKIQDKTRHFIDNMNIQLSEINLRHDIETENIICHHCKNPGHREDKCYSKQKGYPPRHTARNFQSTPSTSILPEQVFLN